MKPAPIIFMDTAAKAGLTRWRHTAGTPEKRFILEAKGAGVALLDFDNDGWLDIYFVNGSTYKALDDGRKRHRRLHFFITITTEHSPMSQPRQA